jgi:hypothetical protein
MSVDSGSRTQSTLGGRLAVPWSTVLPSAILMAYADGFWMMTLRGAIGAIERTQEPFTGWWRESTLVLPLYVLAVLGALLLALRWFGPVLPSLRAVAATAVLTALAGTLLGVAEIVGSSVYDYHLESDQLALMDSMHGICVGSCLDQAQQSALAAFVRAVLYTSGFILITNLVLVGWLVAIRGGRLAVTAAGRRPVQLVDIQFAAGSRTSDLRLYLVACLIASAHLHAAVIPEHLTQWPAAGAFFALLTAAEIAVAATLLWPRPRRVALIAAAAVSAGPLLLWLYSRTAGLPFGPLTGQPEPVGLPDVVCCALEIVTLSAAVILLRRESRWLRGGPAASAHIRAITFVAIVAATAIGLAGVAPAWFDGSESPPEMTMSS